MLLFFKFIYLLKHYIKLFVSTIVEHVRMKEKIIEKLTVFEREEKIDWDLKSISRELISIKRV